MSVKQRLNHCYAPGCTTGYARTKSAKKLSLFKVPVDPERRCVWERTLHRADKPLTEDCAMASEASRRRASYCCVVDCNNSRSNTKGRQPPVKFYRFPNKWYEQDRRKAWITAVRRVNPDGTPWVPATWTEICSAHFVGNCKNDISNHPSYNPTIFPPVYWKKASEEGRALRWQRRLTKGGQHTAGEQLSSQRATVPTSTEPPEVFVDMIHQQQGLPVDCGDPFLADESVHGNTEYFSSTAKASVACQTEPSSFGKLDLILSMTNGSEASCQVTHTEQTHQLAWSCPQKHQLTICNGKCTCKAGVCSSINSHEEQSCTTEPQQWGKPSCKNMRPSSEDGVNLLPSQKANCPDVQPASRTILLKYPEIVCSLQEVLALTTLHADELICKKALDDVVESASKAVERELLEELLAPMLMRPIYHHLEIIDDEMTQPKDFLSELSADHAEEYKRKILVHGSVTDLPILTQGQANCARWHMERRLRISGSKAHTIVTKKSDDGLRKAAQQLYKATTYESAAMNYGIQTQDAARQSLEQKLEARVVQTGLVVLPQQPWLCCSPGGLVKIGNETVLIEIKCTYKFKDSPFVNYEERICQLPYLVFTDDAITLKKTHQYYTEIQVSMYILNLQRSLLYIYSPKQSVIVSVIRDELFLWEVIPKMERFYFKFFIPALF